MAFMANRDLKASMASLLASFPVVEKFIFTSGRLGAGTAI